MRILVRRGHAAGRRRLVAVDAPRCDAGNAADTVVTGHLSVRSWKGFRDGALLSAPNRAFRSMKLPRGAPKQEPEDLLAGVPRPLTNITLALRCAVGGVRLNSICERARYLPALSRQILRVGDRVFTIHEDGASDGPVILHRHGTPLADGPFPGWAEDAAVRGARLICYDRPGYGGSTRMPERTVADAAADSALIMDALGVERFATWGISGGGPHALACAALLPHRVFAAASLAGVAAV